MRFALTIMGLLSFLFGCKPKQSPFAKKDGVWYYRDEAIADIDQRTFEPLDDHYAKDQSQVYYCDTYRKGQEYWAIRHNRVEVIKGAHAPTFALLGQRYARDSGRVYFNGAAIAVKDPATFTVLDKGFARDRLTGYYREVPIPGSDGATFSFIDYNYSRDASNAFYSWIEPGTNGSPPVRKTVRLVDVRPASLVSLGDDYASDSVRAYHKGRLVTTNAESFRVLQRGYAVSSEAVYYEGRVVRDADPATFAVVDALSDSLDARDTRRAYQQGRPVSVAR
jgi:hypothetical protein